MNPKEKLKKVKSEDEFLTLLYLMGSTIARECLAEAEEKQDQEKQAIFMKSYLKIQKNMGEMSRSLESWKS